MPHLWQPRAYQLPAWKALERGCRRVVCVWHRRAGKDATCLHWASVAALQRVGTYWHMLPTLAQGRKVVWDGITRDGRKVLDAWPEQLVANRRNDEMKLELKNGSMWQVVGSDNYNSLVGANPVGVVFSEYSIADPAAWDFIRPILAENGGWALFAYTPRGRNHGWKLYDMARDNPDWHCSLLTVEDTDAISLDVVEQERQAGMSEEMIQQEFYCSFEAPLFGAYYAKQMLSAEKDGRIGNVPHDEHVQTETWWDLGIGDATAIWFVQRVGQELHAIDYYEASGEPLSHYVKVMREKPYVYADAVLPHDAKARELQTGKSRVDALKSLGVSARVMAASKVDDGIEQVRAALGKTWFDAKKCERGLDALRQYRKETASEKMWRDGNTPEYRDRPLHDWASHGADAFRTGIMHKPSTGFKALNYDARGIV